MYFAGPELSDQNHGKTIQKHERLIAKFFKGTTSEFFLSDQFEDLVDLKQKLPLENTLLIGFNPGFGSGYDLLLHSWARDIVMFLGLGYKLVFTQASDFSDLRGETEVWSQMFNMKAK